MSIQNIIFHEVRKSEKESEATIFERKTENVINDHAQELGGQLSSLFRKTGLYTGQFTVSKSETDQKPHLVTLLEKFYDSKKEVFTDFVVFSHAASEYFKLKLEESHSGKGGYLLFNHYIHNGSHFLSIVLLRKISGLSISAKLTLDEVERLDLDKLHMAARINLTSWLTGTSSRYISFRIGRSAKDVTDYFSKFIGCEEATQTRVDTRNLVLVTKLYCSENSFDDDKTMSIQEFVYERCIDWINDEQPVFIDKLSELLDSAYSPEENGRFLEIAQDDPYYLSNHLPVDRTALRGLTRYSGKTKKLSISFDSNLVNETIFYDGSNGHLKLTDIPINLKQQLSNGTPE